MPRTELTETFPLPHATDAARIDRLNRIARLMDRAVRLPGTRIRFGLDSILGLVPGIGDMLALLPGIYIIGSAWQMGMPAGGIARMAANSAIDTFIGSVPLLGDIFDVGFKSNTRNVALLKDHLDRHK